MADFRETLEITRNQNHNCFLSYSYCWVKEDLAELDADELQSPPMEIEFGQDATIGEVSDRIEAFCPNEDKTFNAITQLMDTGKVKLVDEY